MSGWWLQPLALALIIFLFWGVRRGVRAINDRLDRRSLGAPLVVKENLMAEKKQIAPERDPSRYAVPFTLVGGPMDGQVVDVILAALVDRDIGSLTISDAEQSTYALRCEHRYERIPGAGQQLAYSSTEWVPASTAFVSTEIEGDAS